jgi:chitinase
VDASYKLYCDTLGVPASKINIGVPFYGKAFAGCAGLNAPHAGADTSVFPGSGPFYYDIAPALGKFTRFWDEKAKVPYLVNSASQVLVSYDDEESMRAKGEYVVDHGARGVIIWEITGDFLSDGTTPLLDALVTALRTAPRTDR